MTDEEYVARRSHLQSINPMTADCPPEDEIAELEERYIEQRMGEIMHGLYDDPQRIQTYLIESDYEFSPMLEMCDKFCNIFTNPKSENLIAFLVASGNFFEESVRKEAADYVEGL